MFGMARPPRLAAILFVAALSCSGCGLFESAGEITIGKGSIPDLILDFELPDHSGFLDAQRKARAGADGVPDGVSIDQATLAHVLGMVTLSGQCARTFTKPGKEALGAASDLVARFIACTQSGVCDHLCEGRRGVLIELDTTVLAMTAKNAREVNAKVSQRIENSLVGMRLRFEEVLPYVLEDGARRSMLSRVHVLRAAVEDVAGNRLEVLTDKHLQLLRRGERPRALFDPESAFSKGLVAKLEASEAVTFKLRATVLITAADAYEWPLFGSGVRLRVQPEFVVSVLGSVTG